MVKREGFACRTRKKSAAANSVSSWGSWARRTISFWSSRVPNDLRGEDRLELFNFRVGKTKITEHIAAAVDQFHIVVVGHLSASFNHFSRSRMGSTSIWGVLIRVFDFFLRRVDNPKRCT